MKSHTTTFIVSADPGLHREDPNTYNINPSPGKWIVASIWAVDQNDDSEDTNRKQRPPEQSGDRLASTLVARYLEAPDLWIELRIHQRAQNRRMNGECQIIEAYRGLR